MKYFEHQKVNNFIGFTLFFMSFKVPVPTIPPGFMVIRCEVFNAGFDGSSPMLPNGHGIGIIPGVSVDFLNRRNENC